MTAELLQSVLGLSVVLNYLALSLWAWFFIYKHDWLYKFHGQWFTMSLEKFDFAHYAGIAFYKVVIFAFFLAPYLAINFNR